LKHFLDNRDAFAFDRDNPNTGHRYLNPPRRRRQESPPAILFAAGVEASASAETSE
jgi:serine protease Do